MMMIGRGGSVCMIEGFWSCRVRIDDRGRSA